MQEALGGYTCMLSQSPYFKVITGCSNGFLHNDSTCIYYSIIVHKGYPIHASCGFKVDEIGAHSGVVTRVN